MKIIFAVCLVVFAVTTASSQSAIPETDPCTTAKAQLTRAEAILVDWPQLSRYRDANAQLAPPARNANRVVFVGDSITDSWDDPQFGGFFPGKPYVNRGISGQTTAQMLIRFRADAIALKPRVVVILAGTNDIAGNTGPTTIEAIADNLISIVELARQNHIRVVLASVLPISDYSLRDGKPLVQSVRRPPEKIKQLNDWLKNYAVANQLIYLDYFSAMVDEKGFLKADLSYDGLHPNQTGYAVMAPLAGQAIAKALQH